MTVSLRDSYIPCQENCSLLPVDLSSAEPHPSPVYDLIANVIHESVAGTTRNKEDTVWKVQLRAGSGENEKWFQIQDLIVEEIRKEMIFLGETVIQVPISPHGHHTVADNSLFRSGNASNPQWRVEKDGSVQTTYSSMHPISHSILPDCYGSTLSVNYKPLHVLRLRVTMVTT